MDFSKISDEELNNEFFRRKNEKRLKKIDERAKRIRLLNENRSTLLKFISHSRTSCSDMEPNNGLHSSDHGPRCIRCGLMEITEYDAEFFDFNINISIVRVGDD
jgi:hypothetical protein